MPRRLFAAFTLAALVLTGCGDAENALTGSEDPSDDTTEDAGSDAPPVSCLSFAKNVTKAVAATGTPEPFVPSGPVEELCVHDVIVGDGDEITERDAEGGAPVQVHYVGFGQRTRKKFDSSFDRDEPASFALDEVIPGWTEGLVGMKVGGRRQITIPGEKAYGEAPPTSDILPNETLVFVVDLLGIEPVPEPLPEPELTLPDAPVTELVVEDLAPGTGAEITTDTTGVLRVHLLGRSAVNEIDIVSTYSMGGPQELAYPVTQVPGAEAITEGLVGMKVGGRRKLIVPGEQAFGAEPPLGSGLDPDETVVFLIELVDLRT